MNAESPENFEWDERDPRFEDARTAGEYLSELTSRALDGWKELIAWEEQQLEEAEARGDYDSASRSSEFLALYHDAVRDIHTAWYAACPVVAPREQGSLF